jgi:hypothetical protein
MTILIDREIRENWKTEHTPYLSELHEINQMKIISESESQLDDPPSESSDPIILKQDKNDFNINKENLPKNKKKNKKEKATKPPKKNFRDENFEEVKTIPIQNEEDIKSDDEEEQPHIFIKCFFKEESVRLNSMLYNVNSVNVLSSEEFGIESKNNEVFEKCMSTVKNLPNSERRNLYIGNYRKVNFKFLKIHLDRWSIWKVLSEIFTRIG